MLLYASSVGSLRTRSRAAGPVLLDCSSTAISSRRCAGILFLGAIIGWHVCHAGYCLPGALCCLHHAVARGLTYADLVMICDTSSVQCITPAVDMFWKVCRGSAFVSGTVHSDAVLASLWLWLWLWPLVTLPTH